MRKGTGDDPTRKLQTKVTNFHDIQVRNSHSAAAGRDSCKSDNCNAGVGRARLAISRFRLTVSDMPKSG